MSSLIQARRRLRNRIHENVELDRYAHLFVTLLLTCNMLLIMYALISVTARMSLSGVGLVDSLPIALYILPLMIFLPIMIRAFYRERTAAWNFVFLMICTVFFSLLSQLVRGFVIFLVLNVSAAVLLFLMGRFRPKGSLKKAGKKGLLYVVLLNMLGLTFPISTVIMGQTPIVGVVVTQPGDVSLEVPLAMFDFPYVNLTPTSGILDDIEDFDFAIDLHVQEGDASSWQRLEDWVIALNSTSIMYTITFTAPGYTLSGGTIRSLTSTERLLQFYGNHSQALDQLDFLLTTQGITNLPSVVLFDMTLPRNYWQKLMLHTRSLDLSGFSGLMRTSLYAVNPLEIQDAALDLVAQADSLGLAPGVMVEPFVVDDVLDGDTVAMRLCGQTVNTLKLWDRIDVLCSRTRFSYEMLGDVGEYMAASFASAIGSLGANWSMRMGEVGNRSDISDRTDSVYNSMDSLTRDIALSFGSGTEAITLSSLQSLMMFFGSGSIESLRSSIDAVDRANATYTFRIYAFRAVFAAIDSFDFLMA